MTLIVPWRDLHLVDARGRLVAAGPATDRALRQLYHADHGGPRAAVSGLHFDGEDFVSPGVFVSIDWSGYEPTP